MSELSLTLADEAATCALGSALANAIQKHRAAAELQKCCTVFLQGTLGAGKTTFTRGVLTQLGHSGTVKSPTYTLVEPYQLPHWQVNHFDLYRLGDPEELEYMGIRDYFTANSICLIEWPERGLGVLPAPDITVKVSVAGSGRIAKLTADSALGKQLLAELKQHHQSEKK